MERRHLIISGLVQGVGFRPFFHNLALQNGLTGWIRNNSAGVEAEIQGEVETINTFVGTIKEMAPPAAVIDQISSSGIPAQTETGFTIQPSLSGTVEGSPLPDQGICRQCATELFDPSNRRYLHPFNSCTLCGPRFTIIRDLPFDRTRTTMDEFELCADCQNEYSSPADRRFHAQTLACPNCGPQLWFTGPDGKLAPGDPIESALRILSSGGIIAVKGIGGYHLACDAFCDPAVNRLRKHKERDQRPFAVMFKDLQSLKTHCDTNLDEEHILNSPIRPIVLIRQKPESTLARSVNPGLQELGVFLPYTGIHHFLFGRRMTALVMTSGNRASEPLCKDDPDALLDLGPMVDGFLGHNRIILWRCDDSVLRVVRGKLLGLRRSRGFVPAPVKLGRELVPLLACGAQQKNVFALTRGKQVFLSPHLGDLDHRTAFLVYRETIAGFTKLLNCRPDWVIHDLHPDYQSTGYALNSGLKAIGVQHHIAHLGSVIAAQQIKGPVIGIIFDGSGYGTDGKIWGGEFFAGEGCSWQRMGQLVYYPLPGGEAAIREPWRLAASYLDRHDPVILEDWLSQRYLNQKWAALRKAIQLGINAPLTSSTGRFFDGIASLAGGIMKVTYEGEAAVWLEHQADLTVQGNYEFQILSSNGIYQVDPGPLATQVLRDLAHSTAGAVSMKFHRTIALLTGEMAGLVRAETGYDQIVLSGGVFQNRLLLVLTWEILEKKGFRVFLPEIIPVNDAGISLGQAWVGNLMIERGVSDVFGHSR